MRMLPARDAYELWSETYPPTAHNPLMQAEQAAVLERLTPIRATRALDVGTGSGRCVPMLAATGARDVVCADLSIGMLRRNRHRHRICADAHHLPLPSAAFDLVNASLMAGDITDLSPWLAELSRVLMPGGHLIYSDFHPIWTERGWQRTFETVDGQQCALPRAPHTLNEHVSALKRAGLVVVATNEVHLPDPQRGVLRLLKPRDVPVVVVFHARKADV
jgi:malonyl-CoA O-methyltransferase